MQWLKKLFRQTSPSAAPEADKQQLAVQTCEVLVRLAIDKVAKSGEKFGFEAHGRHFPELLGLGLFACQTSAIVVLRDPPAVEKFTADLCDRFAAELVKQGVYNDEQGGQLTALLGQRLQVYTGLRQTYSRSLQQGDLEPLLKAAAFYFERFCRGLPLEEEGDEEMTKEDALLIGRLRWTGQQFWLTVLKNSQEMLKLSLS